MGTKCGRPTVNTMLQAKFDALPTSPLSDSPRECFCEDSSRVPIRIVTVLSTSITPDDDTIRNCRLEPTTISKPSDVSSLVGVVSNAGSKDYVARLILLTQSHTWGPMNARQDTLKELMVEHNITESFLDVLSTFYARDNRVEEGYFAPFVMHESDDYIEYMYCFGYAEHTGRETKHPWSIRKTGFYHQIRRCDHRSTYVLISPYEETRAQERMLGWFSNMSSKSAWQTDSLMANKILFDSYVQGCQFFTSFYEETIEQLSMSMITSGLEESQSVTSKDLKIINIAEQRLSPISCALVAFEGILDGLERVSNRFGALQTDANPMNQQIVLDTVANYRQKILADKAHFFLVMAKCQNVTRFLGGIITLDDQQLTRQQSGRIFQLTTLTAGDSATVRVITTLTLVFLSFTAVAAVMAMPLFYLDQNSKHLSVSPSWWAYLAIALPLTISTMIYWQWRLRKKLKERERELVVKSGV